jgi:hypothetical protein
MRTQAAAWLLGATLCVAAAIVVIVVLQPHWQAREGDWMSGGILVLVACALGAQAAFRRANRDSSPADDFEASLLDDLDSLRQSRLMLEEMAAKLEDARRRDLLDADAARSVEQLQASLEQQQGSAQFLDEHARVLRRNLRLARLLAWVAGAILTLILLELDR